MPVVALVGGVGAGAVRLLFVYTIFASSWPKEWPRELASEVVGVALLVVVVAVLRGMASAAQDGATGVPGWRSGATLGTLGLLAPGGSGTGKKSVTEAWLSLASAAAVGVCRDPAAQSCQQTWTS